MSRSTFRKWWNRFRQDRRAHRHNRQLKDRFSPYLESLEERRLLTVNLLSQFTGLAHSDTQGYVPPDTSGAAGPVKFVETVNLTLRVSNKADGSSPVTDTFSHFMVTTGGLARADGTSGFSDPIVVWDEQVQRFIVGVQDVNFSTHVSTFDIAVSKSASPASLGTADWNFFQINTTENNGTNAIYDADYPGNFGFNADAFVFTLNMFVVVGTQHVQVNSVKISDLVNGTLTAYRNDISGVFSLRPTVMHDAVAGDPMWLVTTGTSTSIKVLKMTNVLSNAAAFATTSLTVNSYSSINYPLQPDGTQVVTNIDTRIMNAAERNGKLVTAHHVGVSTTQDDARWYVVDVSSGTPTLSDQGDVVNATTGAGTNNVYDYYPTIDINNSGTIGMSFMQSSHTGTGTGEFVSVYVTGRTSSDAPGTMETPVLVKAGAKNYSASGRAGDLSGINVDSDGTFWIANEYANSEASSNWGTVIAHFSLQLGVISSTPANGTVVTTLPTSFVINFNAAVAPGSLQSADLKVNGISADAVVLSNGNATATFTFNTNPVTSEGSQSMTIAAGAITGVDGNVNGAYNATFRYDTVPMQVVSTSPANGSAVTLPLTTLDVTLNEAYDAATVGTNDLTLSQGSVVAATALNSTTVRYTLSGVIAEGTLTVNMAAGALADFFGNPMLAYSGSFVLDAGIVAFPLPLPDKSPQGSLIYSGSASGTIGSVGDTDGYTIALEAGQTITVLASPAAGLTTSIELRDASNNLVSSTTSSGAGLEAVLQSIVIGAAGTYTIIVSGAASTTGAYTLQISLNAALEAEAHGGATNDTRATAQNLDGSFITLAGGGQRGAVLGSATSTVSAVASETFESGVLGSAWSTYSSDAVNGRLQVTGAYGTASGSYALLMDHNDGNGSTYNLNEAVWTVNLAGLSQATLTFFAESYSDEDDALASTFTGHSNGDGVAISADGTNWYRVWQAVSTSSFTAVTVDLAAAATAAGITLGANFKIKFQQYDNFNLTTDGRGWDDITINVPAAPDDWYGFTLAAGDSATLALKSLDATTPNVKLVDSTGAVLAWSSTSASNLTRVVSDFVAPTSGTYYAQVIGAAAGTYSMTVLRNADFDTETNDTTASAQRVQSRMISGAQAVLGDIGGTFSSVIDFNDLAEQPVDGISYNGVTFGFTLDGTASDDATFGAESDEHASLMNDKFLEGNAAGVLSLSFAQPTTHVSFNLTLEEPDEDPKAGSGGDLDAGNGRLCFVRLYDVMGNLIGAQQVLALAKGEETFFETSFSYDGVAVAQVQVDFAQDPDITFGLDDLSVLSGNTVDTYAVSLTAGAVLQLATKTPGDGGGALTNGFNPRIRLLNSSGTQVAIDDNSAPDGRNAQLTYTAPGAGTYYIEVSSTTASSTVGEYVLTVNGAAGTAPAFAVASTNPAAGAALPSAPTQVTVTFNDAVLLTSLSAADLTVDGIAATSYSIVDASTVSFTLSGSLANGSHQIAIASGAILDLQSTPIAAYFSQFTIDTVAPRIVSSSIQQGDVLATGGLSYVVSFSEVMQSANLDATDFTLHGNIRNVDYAATSFSYNAGATTLTINFTNLPEDSYTLTLLSADGRFEDAAGNDLDGEPVFPMPPNSSGNGVAGGNFVVTFSTDVGTTAFPTPLTAEPMPGSLIYRSSTTTPNVAYIGGAGDTDDVSIALDAGQSLGAVITPTGGLQASLSIYDPGNNLLGTFNASAAGATLIVQSVAISATGTYTLRFSGSGGTIGSASTVLTLNAAVEAETYGGPTDNALASAQLFDAAFIALGGSAARGAVVGKMDGGASNSYAAAAVTPAFTDISTTGTKSTAVGDDSAVTLTSTQLGGFTFSFFGTVYNSLSYNTNGLISFTTADAEYSNTDLSTSPSEPVIAALWDDLYIENTGIGAASRNIYWQVIGSGANEQLVIQWNNARRLSGTTYFSFEAVLSIDGTVQFNYGSTVDSSVVSSATVGIKGAGTSNPSRLLVSYNQAPGAFVGASLSTRLGIPQETPDYYAFTASAGQSLSLALSDTAGDYQVTLQDASGNALTTGAATANLDSWIGNYLATASGTYYAVVSGTQNGGLPYDLVVTRGAAYDNGANHTLATAQDINAPRSALGYVDASSDYYSIQVVASKLLTISTTTPADGTGQFVNTLNPAIELYNSSGTLVASNDNGATDGRNALLNYNASAGTYKIRVLATSGTGEYVLKVVETTNNTTPPTITPIADQTINEDGSVNVNFTVADVDTPLNQLTVGATSGNTTILPNASLMLTDLGGGNWKLTATPAANQNGSVTVTAMVSDGTTVSTTFTLNVNAVNDAPSFTKGADQSIAYTTAAQTVANWATSISAGPNESSQTLTFQVADDNPALFTVQPTISSSGTLTYTPSGVLGTAVVTVTLQDNGGTGNGGVNTSAPQTFTIQIVPGASLSAGSLDPSFDGDGVKSFVSPYGSFDVAHDIAQQTDGKYVVIGTIDDGTNVGGAVSRYNVDGSLDTTFGSGGIVRLNVSTVSANFSAVKIQSDGKVLVAGYNASSGYVVRLNTNGSFDSTFASGGVFSNSFGNTTSSVAYGVGLSLQSDGKIVLTKHKRDSTTQTFNDIMVARLTTTGVLDTTFAGIGYTILSISSTGHDTPFDAAVQSDGKIVVVGVTATSSSVTTNDFFAARYNSDGTLDTSFGGGLGYTVINVTASTASDIAYRVAIQSDGKILLGGQANNHFGVVRLNTDGSLDTSFGGTGKVTTSIGTTDDAFAMALQSNGKIVLGGYSGASASVYDFAMARYNTDGSLDTSFNGTGKKTYSVGPNAEQIYGLLVQSDGKLAVAGGAVPGATGGGDFALARFNADASLDTSFATAGVGTLNIDVTSATAHAVLPLADGTTLVGGYLKKSSTTTLSTSTQFAAVWRLLADGTLDTSFGANGYFISTNSSLSDVAQLIVQSDGKILVVGNFFLARLSAAGVIDTTFGASGYLTLPGSYTAQAAALQADGKLLVGGYYSGGSTVDFAVVRYTTAGVLDATFAGTGMAVADLLGSSDDGNALAVQADGKIVVAGDAFNGSNFDIGVVRFNADGTLDTSFNGTGKFTTPLGTGTDSARAVAIQADGKIVVGGYFTSTSNGDDFSLLRLTASGALDSSFGTGGIVSTTVSTTTDRMSSIILPGDGTILAIGYGFGTTGNNRVVVARYSTNGSLDTSFGGTGIVLTDVSTSTEFAFGSALQADGRLLVAGYYFVASPAPTRYEGFVLRYATQSSSQNVPSITAIADQTTNEGLATGAIAFTVSHPTLPASSLSVSATSSNTTLVSNANLALVNLGNGNWTISATPTAFQAGSALITVTASDGTYTYAETFTVTVNAAPIVTGVYAQGSSWNSSFTTYQSNNNLGDATLGFKLSNGANQLKTLPWTNVNTVSIQFSEGVTIGQNDLTVVASTNGSVVPAISGFAWNSSTFVATWTFASALPRDKLLLHLGNTVVDGLGAALDGEWTDAVSTVSGNGVTGGDFNFRFNVLPNDNDGSNSVTLTEVLQARNRAGKGTLSTGYTYREDSDGSGTITLTEVLQGRNRASTSITGLNEPIAPGSSPQLAAVEADPVMNAAGEFVSPWTPLTLDELAPLVAEAKRRWEASGMVAGPIDWSRLHVTISDLGGILGLTDPNGLVRIDDDGAGWDWFVDATPQDDAEFAATESPAELAALADGPAAGRSDLLTTVMHELGIFLGFHDIPANQPPTVLMTETLGVSTRRLVAVPLPVPQEPIVTESPVVVEMPILVETLIVVESLDVTTAPPLADAPIVDVPAPATLPDPTIDAPIFVAALSPIRPVDSVTIPSVGVRPEHAALALWLASRSNGDDAGSITTESGNGTRTGAKLSRPVDHFAAWGRA